MTWHGLERLNHGWPSRWYVERDGGAGWLADRQLISSVHPSELGGHYSGYSTFGPSVDLRVRVSPTHKSERRRARPGRFHAEVVFDSARETVWASAGFDRCRSVKDALEKVDANDVGVQGALGRLLARLFDPKNAKSVYLEIGPGYYLPFMSTYRWMPSTWEAGRYYTAETGYLCHVAVVDHNGQYALSADGVPSGILGWVRPGSMDPDAVAREWGEVRVAAEAHHRLMRVHDAA